MKYYIVFDNSYRLIGFLQDKKDVEIFKRQRDMTRFIIQTMKEDDMPPKLQKDLEIARRDGEVATRSGYLMFPGEEEYFNLSFDQLLIDIQLYLTYLVRDRLPYIKLDVEEREIIDRFVYRVFNMIRDLSERWNEGDEDDIIDIGDYFNEVAMVRDFISRSGG